MAGCWRWLFAEFAGFALHFLKDSWTEARGDPILCDGWCLGEVHVARCDMVTVGYKSNLCGNSQALYNVSEHFARDVPGMLQRPALRGDSGNMWHLLKRLPIEQGVCNRRFLCWAVRWANFPSA